MKTTDRTEFAAMLTATVVGVYSKPAPSHDVIGIWFSALQGFDLPDVRRAFSLHVRDPDRGQYPPRPADITRFIEGSTQTQGTLAWSKVEKAMRCVGGYQTVVFDDPLIHAVIAELGGWPALCRVETKELPFKAKDFERRYGAHRSMRQLPAYQPSLSGITETERRAGGYELPPPVLVGDHEKAARVLTGGDETKPLGIALQSALEHL